MRTVSGEITRQVVWDPSFGGRDNNLAFSFTKLNLRETLNHAKIDEIELAHMPSRSINEKRMEKGLEPLTEEHFNYPMVITPTGAVSLPFNCSGMYRGYVRGDNVLRTAIYDEPFVELGRD